MGVAIDLRYYPTRDSYMCEKRILLIIPYRCGWKPHLGPVEMSVYLLVYHIKNLHRYNRCCSI